MNKLTSKNNIITEIIKLHSIKVGFFVILLIIIPLVGFTQINIEDVGDNWKQKVNTALGIIRQNDSVKYQDILKVCNHISFWNGAFSTTEDSTTILISLNDMNLSSINNISAIIVHESYHLWVIRNKVKLDPRREELLAYTYEFNFLTRVKNIEPWLINHSIKMIRYFE